MKSIDDLQKDYEAQQQDFNHFAKGVPFSQVRACGAQSLFGSKWRKIILDHLGEGELMLLAERERGTNKLIDFPLAALDVGDKIKVFTKGEKVAIETKGGDGTYTGIYDVLACLDKQYVIILKGQDKDASGHIINQSRLNGADKAMKKTKTRISKLEGAEKEPDTLGEEPSLNPKERPAKDDTKKNKTSSGKKWLFLILALLMLFYVATNIKNEES